MKRTKRKTLIIIAALLVVVLSLITFILYKTTEAPDRSEYTTILTWWGYLDDLGKLKELETLCDTKVRTVEYLNADELLSYAASTPYDLYIYPWSYHQDIHLHFNQEGPRINQVVKHYHSTIRKKYHRFNIGQDTVFFQHAVRMFVYDKEHIPDLNKLTARAFLNYANVGNVYLMDDIKQMDWLIKQLKLSTPTENWIAVYQQIKAHESLQTQPYRHNPQPIGMYFSNFATQYVDNDLVVGLLDSGELMNPNIRWDKLSKAGQPKAVGFGVHPTLSSVASDVLALKSHDSKDQCVAKAMVGRDFLRWISETSFTYSPFEERIDSLPDPLPRLTQAFYEKANQMPWLDEAAANDPPDRDAQIIWGLMTQPGAKRQQNQDVTLKWDPVSGLRISRLPSWLVQLFPFLE